VDVNRLEPRDGLVSSSAGAVVSSGNAKELTNEKQITRAVMGNQVVEGNDTQGYRIVSPAQAGGQ
jgi:hypothetical protein